MAKRFTDTDKWKRPWFRDLPPKMRELWGYMLDNCDLAGVWVEDLRGAALMLGYKIDQAEYAAHLGPKLVRVASDKVFIPSFIEFQYGELQETNKLHLAAIRILNRCGIDPTTLTSEGGSKGDLGTIHGHKDKEEDKDKVMEEGGAGGEAAPTSPQLPTLGRIWNEFCGQLPQIKSCAGARRRHAEARWRDTPDQTYWKGVVERLARSPFCLGDNDRGWRADFDFLVKPDTHAKVTEGKYDARETVHKLPPRKSAAEEQYERELAEARARGEVLPGA